MKKRSKKEQKLKAASQKNQRAEEPSSEKAKTFDFGGLPERDLKKNLGC